MLLLHPACCTHRGPGSDFATAHLAWAISRPQPTGNVGRSPFPRSPNHSTTTDRPKEQQQPRSRFNQKLVGLAPALGLASSLAQTAGGPRSQIKKAPTQAPKTLPRTQNPIHPQGIRRARGVGRRSSSKSRRRNVTLGFGPASKIKGPHHAQCASRRQTDTEYARESKQAR